MVLNIAQILVLYLQELLHYIFLPNQNHPKLKDTNKHQGLRNQLVKQLEEKGITDKNVLAAIGKIPRHLFLDSSFLFNSIAKSKESKE